MCRKNKNENSIQLPNVLFPYKNISDAINVSAFQYFKMSVKVMVAKYFPFNHYKKQYNIRTVLGKPYKYLQLWNKGTKKINFTKRSTLYEIQKEYMTHQKFLNR